ncbi:efflux RND transporter permease subunit [Rivihabitans pingtungensis]|jgi:HAE1 family hydrophobic/amphiphilic exporter-1/multidrug efflux pump|uniref:Efflux pump membrane transporter n=2 Tax=Rivihabitans pingtungensis TaxID=1054498 RepID=A0A318KNM4_9NEIS|nr:efflux RND transporter permease subunit [Rivihabitans pingtungensis]PXX78328.1 HAE1 family hydrophobic/amphiphilic exporter-1/multidrug efflux pump [Rivihabitans pingtungensis]
MFSAFFIRRPIFACVISIIILLAGFAAMRALSVEQYPQIVPPQVQVTAIYPGASAEVIAQTVAAPLEQQINGVDNMLYINSASASNGQLALTVTFAIGTNADQATINVNNRVQSALAQLPEEVRRQGVTVQKQSANFLQVIALDAPDKRYDSVYISNYALVNVLDEIKRIPGVGEAMIFGAKDYSMRIWLKPDRMAQLKLTPSQVAEAIREQNAQFAAGKVGAEPTRSPVEFTYTVTTQGRLQSTEEFENIIVRANPDGSKVRVKDIARVELGARDYSFSATRNGQPTIPIGIYLAPGANQLDTAQAVRAKMVELKKRFPAGLEYKIPYDTTRFVEVSIDEVVKTLGEAMVLVFLVVYLFLQNWRATLIPSLAVPVSIVGTFAGMYLLGFSINTLTLFGMVLAIGIVVDDAIVVLENVERIMEEDKLSPVDATLKAMQEVTGPVIAIVLVLCAVFIPVAFLGGLAGQMYKQFAITIAMSVVISGIVALTLTPALCAVLLKPGHQAAHKFFDVFNNWFARMTGRYTRGVAFFVRRSALGLLVCGGIVAVTLGLFRVVPGGLVPDEDQGYVIAVTLLPDGASLSRTQHATQQVDKLAMAHPAVTDVLTFTGFDLLTGSFKTNSGASFLTLKDWKERRAESDQAQSIVGYMFGAGMGVKEAMVLAFNPPPISGMSSTGGFEVYVQNRGNGGSKDLAAATQKLIEAAHKRPELGQLSTTFSADVPQLFIELDREKAKTYGVPINDVFDTMQSTFGELYVNDFNKLGRTFRVQLQSEADFRSRPEDIRNIHVRSQSGEMIPLTALVTVKQVTGPEIVERYNIFPSAKIVGGPAPGYSSGQAIAAMEELAAQVLSDDYSLAWTGSAFQEKQTGGASTLVFVFALVMVFLILAAQYERWNLPIAVLLAVPFAVFGAISANWLRGMANDVYFQIALVTLIGLAAKNAILIVEFAMLKLEEGLSLADAAIAAARLRFRPIIMTSLAFVLGCVPLAISTGAGASSRHSIGTGVIGGMLAATFIATFFIPMLFMLIMRLGRRPAPVAVSQHDGKDA